MTTSKLTPDQQVKHAEVMRLAGTYAYAVAYYANDVIKERKANLSTTIAQLCAQIIVNEEFKMLTDAQWTNIVNAHHAYEFWEKEDAVSDAVKLTENQLQKNFKFLQSERDQLKAENERLKAICDARERMIRDLTGYISDSEKKDCMACDPSVGFICELHGDKP